MEPLECNHTIGWVLWKFWEETWKLSDDSNYWRTPSLDFYDQLPKNSGQAVANWKTFEHISFNRWGLVEDEKLAYDGRHWPGISANLNISFQWALLLPRLYFRKRSAPQHIVVRTLNI